MMAALGSALLLMSLCLSVKGINNLSCVFNYNKRIQCDWATERMDRCSLQATTINAYNITNFFRQFGSSCLMETTDKPRLRRCFLVFHKKILSSTVLSLNLSCDHMTQSLLSIYTPFDHIKVDRLEAPTVNGSIVSWKKAAVLRDNRLQYEIQWTGHDQPWTVDSSRLLAECRADLVNDLEVGQKYSARVRVQIDLKSGSSQWSEWSPTVSWESTVERNQTSTQHRLEGPELWTPLSVLGSVLGLVLVLWTSRFHRVVLMKAMKGVSWTGPAPVVLTKGWQPPLFSSDAYWTFLKPMDTIAHLELLPLQSRFKSRSESRSEPHSLLGLEENPPSSSSSPHFSPSNISNPMYSQLCPQQPPESDPESGPEPEPGPESSGPHGWNLVPASCLDLDVLRLLSEPQSSGLLVVCEYEQVKVEERVRLTSVDSGVGSGEEVSQESVNLEEHHHGATLAGPTLLHTFEQTGAHAPSDPQHALNDF